MRHIRLFNSPWFLCAIITTACVLNVVHSQNVNLTSLLSSNSTVTDILGVLNSLDIQKMIRDMQKDGTLEELAVMLATGSSDGLNVNGKCLNDVLTMVQGVSDMNMWALKMIDAIGKPHSGIISDLDFNWLGSYDECLAIKAITYSNDTLQSDPVHHFDGKYCQIGIPVATAIAQNVNPLVAPLLGNLKVGVCISDACNTDDMKNMMNFVAKYVFNASSEYEPDAQCHDGMEVETKTIVAIAILSLLGVVVVIGTLYDICLRLKKKPDVEERQHVTENIEHQTNGDLNIGAIKVDLSIINDGTANGNLGMKKTANSDIPVQNTQPQRVASKPSEKHSTLENIFLSFSVYTNGLKLLSANQPRGALTCINGIRFLSMTWVILGHSLSFTVKNAIPYWFQKKVWQWTFYGIYSATVSVDTFFTMSGLLVAYLTLKEMSKRGGAKKMNWFMFYFHRYWRLTPAYMLSLMVYTTIIKHIGDGPKWPQQDIAGDNCAISWWTNLLYINNYVEIKHGCFEWSWYLANDMQFYILSPLIIVPLFYNVYIGGAIASVFLIATTVARAVISKQHEYTALFGGLIGPQPKDQDYAEFLYFPAHTRMGPYIIGLLTGYLLYRYKDTFKMKRTWNLLGWLCCFATIILIIYGVYPDDGKHYLTVNESVAFLTLHRTAWGMAISWIIFACATGHGGWINEFLSWSPFGPLGRLSYCAYLVHYVCLTVYSNSQRMNIYQTDYEEIYFYIGNVVISYFVAFGTSLLFESPMMGLEKILFKRN